jgi:diaminohydroxyphosphoribosylaminopyrimidine deaminase/5-amino-6-(5-phosphoribosylamino)uracil reductase
VLRRLAQLQANEVWVEAGARLAGALLHADLVDELILYVAPSLLGHCARALVELPDISKLDTRLQLKFTEITPIASDLRITAVPAHRVIRA